MGIQRWEAQELPVNSMKCVILKDAARCYGGTTKNPRAHKDDPHFGVWNTNVERKMDWTPFHSTKGVWTQPVPHDTTHLDDQTEGYIEAIAC